MATGLDKGKELWVENGQTMVAEIDAKEREPLSYKDKLLGFNGDHSDDSEKEERQFLEEDEEECMNDMGDTEADVEDPTCPIMYVSQEEKKELCKPWRLTLIIKLLGKRLGMRFLKMRIQKLWALQGSYEFIDMENDYYLVRFSNVKDYNFVLQEGPWLIADHYLITQRWRPNFNPYEDEFKKTAIWARVPGLPIEFYNKHFLWRVGNRIGSTVKVDTNTLRRKENGEEELIERAKFARICVEVDLRKRFFIEV